MGRKKLEKPPKKLEIGLAPEIHGCLQKLQKMGGYGTTPTEVARYLIQRSIDDLRREGVINQDLEAPVSKA
jgi:hypothetical protein